MSNEDIFTLTRIIKEAWGNPGDITGAVWGAGYRRPEPTAEEAAMLTIDRLGDYDSNGIPREHWPKSYQEILSHELNNLIFDATWPEHTSPVSVARKIIEAGYREEPASD